MLPLILKKATSNVDGLLMDSGAAPRLLYLYLYLYLTVSVLVHKKWLL